MQDSYWPKIRQDGHYRDGIDSLLACRYVYLLPVQEWLRHFSYRIFTGTCRPRDGIDQEFEFWFARYKTNAGPTVMIRVSIRCGCAIPKRYISINVPVV